MDENEIIKLYKQGMTPKKVAEEYMNEHNDKAKKYRDTDKINMKQALEYVYPILMAEYKREVRA